MTRKSPTPRLRSYWKSAHAQSCADGTIKITPHWRIWGPGVMTRMGAALALANLIEAELKKR